MLTPKQNFLQVLQTGKPEYVAGSWDFSARNAFGYPTFTDPFSAAEYPAYEPDMEGVDPWGVKWIWLADTPGAHPSSYREDIVITDICRWREQLTLPQVGDGDWTELLRTIDGVDREQQAIVFMLFPGIFERACSLLGFSECLLALMEHPQELNELFGAICDIKMQVVDDIFDHVRPDLIHSHDDWGNKTAPFIRPSLWRELLKPHYVRLYGHIRARGALISHHADCFCSPLAQDMVDLGINIWQGVTPENDIPAVQAAVQGKLTLMGGINAPIVDRVGASEENIREEVRRCLREYCPGGYFLPCVTSEQAFTPGVQEIIDDELRRANVSVYD